ncbi:MAG: 3-dehydroquinate synthase [Bacilli bacterium]|nr:3-dehydroquinate synthase [Bacilli bacterium]
MKAVYQHQTVDILVKEGILSRLLEHLDPHRRYFIITDQIVHHFYHDYLDQIQNHDVFIMMSGEEQKNMDSILQICKEMLTKNYDRSDCIIALGGGVVIDTAGFVASIYKRGIDYINIPTSLMAQVDSSIGGKVGINYLGYKNQLGSFYHPLKILIDPLVLSTLNKQEMTSGMCEVMKYAILFDCDMYDALLHHQYQLMELIRKCVLYKVEVTTTDERDVGKRQLLNFGHTIGHAIEAKYQLPHGISIAYGMYYESRRQDVLDLLLSYGLDFSISFDGLEEYILKDKKRIKDQIMQVKILDIGKAILVEGDIHDYFTE